MLTFADNIEVAADAADDVSTALTGATTATDNLATAQRDLLPTTEAIATAAKDEAKALSDATKALEASLTTQIEAIRKHNLLRLQYEVDRRSAAAAAEKKAQETEFQALVTHLRRVQDERRADAQRQIDEAIERRHLADERAALLLQRQEDELAADVQHRADLVFSLDAYIALVATQIDAADGAEKKALETQLADLKKQRDDAYAASQQDRLDAAQAEIDAVGAKIKGAQGAELAALKAHQAVLIAQYGLLATGINDELDKIVTDIKINISTRFTAGSYGGRSGDAGDASGGNTAVFNDDGTVQSGSGQDVFLDDAGNAFYDDDLNNPVSDECRIRSMRASIAMAMAYLMPMITTQRMGPLSCHAPAEHGSTWVRLARRRL